MYIMTTRWLKTIIVTVVFVVILVPIVINYLCLTVSPVPLVGDGKLWLGFWGSYLGGIIAVLSTVYVLYRNHEMEYNRKEYEIQKEYFNSLCIDMGELCSAIDLNILSFYLMSMKRIEDANNTIQEIGKLEKAINCEYNEFCLKYAHYRENEGEKLLSTYHNYSKTISNLLSTIQQVVVDRQNNQVSKSVYDSTISKTCKELMQLGDVRMNLLILAEKWKKREFEITNSKRKKYERG